MSLESDLFDYLQTQAAVTALVGTRVYQNVLPQGKDYPAVIYQRISTEHAQHTLGAGGLATARMQFDCWALDAAAAQQVGEALRAALQGFRGEMGDTNIRHCSLENTEGGYDPPADSSDVAAHRVSQDFVIAYFESIPTF